MTPITFALLYADTGDIVGTYESREAALRDLVAFVRENPGLQDDVGLRPYERGRPAGDFKSASELVPELLIQPQLPVRRGRRLRRAAAPSSK